MEKTWRIEQLVTTGWELIDEKYQRLTREQAKNALSQCIEDGYNPNALRAQPDGIAE
tara:strand:- start:695 stop:865 length:171 start_codon:yes stop_codon:yes gene_type:complete